MFTKHYETDTTIVIILQIRRMKLLGVAETPSRVPSYVSHCEDLKPDSLTLHVDAKQLHDAEKGCSPARFHIMVINAKHNDSAVRWSSIQPLKLMSYETLY